NDVFREAVQHIFDRLRDVYRLLHEALRPPSFVVEKFCHSLLSLDRFLKTTITEKSMLQAAKSQKVSLRNHVFHREIDELLGLLSVERVDGIHSWSPVTVAFESVLTGTDGGGLGSSGEVGESPARNDAVRIVRFETTTLNQKFQQVRLDIHGDDGGAETTTTGTSWLIPIYELKYNRDAAIGVGAFGEVFKAKWLNTPVVVKFMGYEA
ncbi:Serine/threonine-protein phosphatase 6 regulatory ankyrin repeat subunit, partial [Globisporangium polare]